MHDRPVLLVAGIATGLLLAAKFTGVFVFPMLLVLVVLECAVARSWQLLQARALALGPG